jgi:transcriptional regulator with XRE-family HTH domain
VKKELKMNRLKELRNKKGITLRELSEKIGDLSFTHLSLIENSQRNLTSKNAQKLADFFGVTVDYLLGRDVNDTASALSKQLDKLTEQYFDEVVQLALKDRAANEQIITKYLIVERLNKMSLEELKEVFRIVEALHPKPKGTGGQWCGGGGGGDRKCLMPGNE